MWLLGLVARCTALCRGVARVRSSLALHAFCRAGPQALPDTFALAFVFRRYGWIAASSCLGGCIRARLTRVY